MSDILVVSLGMTPPVVTETLWYLFRRTPPFVPREIHILTTRLGEQALRRGETGDFLCDPDHDGRIDGDGRGGRLAELYRTFGHPLPTVHIHTSPQAPKDLRDEGSTLDYADLCVRVLAWLRQSRPGARLHVSLAGGRKTMSFYMGYALSLLGEPEDELSHVLIRPADLEGPDFWWPGMPPEVTRNGRTLATARAGIDLVPVPFAPMKAFVRSSMLRELTDGRATYRTLVDMVSGRVVPELRLEQRNGRVVFGANAVTLPPAQYAMLHVLATAWRERWAGYGPEGAGGCGWLVWDDFDPGNRAAELLRDVYQRLSPDGTWKVVEIYEQARRGEDWSRRWQDLRDLLQQTRAKLQRRLRGLAPVGIHELRIGWCSVLVPGPGGDRRRVYVFGLAGVEPGRVRTSDGRDGIPSTGIPHPHAEPSIRPDRR